MCRGVPRSGAPFVVLGADAAAGTRREAIRRRSERVRAIVVADGEPAAGDAGLLDGVDLVVAADAGAGWLAALGRRPDLLVGDLDSVDPGLVEELAAAGVPIERHPAHKDASDTELALERAVAGGADRVVILGALGGARLDHELANLLLLADPAWQRLADLRIVRERTVVRALHAGASLALEAPIGAVVTLIPIAGDADGVRTTGLRYELHGDPLRIGRSRGLSNVVVQRPASVSLERGTLLVIETEP